jgi:filamentous hemagglutinin family protein
MSEMGEIGRQLLRIAISGAYIFTASCATAQISPDRTLPSNSNVTINGSIFNITEGTQAGRNLFHSFQQFSVPTGGTASFNNGLNIQNIISRVTGGSVSNINGIIQANGTANVFLLNPSGIVFGRNASLNIGGSFVATTANAIGFGNQGIFSATNPNNPALLTINPTALLFNQIAVASSIQNSSQASAGTDVAGIETTGLRVRDGQSLLLVGGNVNLNGGRVNANGGRVELGGLAAPGVVGVEINNNEFSLNFPENVPLADVSLNSGSGVRVDKSGGGNIVVNARNLEITGGSTLTGGIEQGLGSSGAQAGNITLKATGDIKVTGNDSHIFNTVQQQALGNAGNVSLTANAFSLTDGAQLSTNTLGEGNAGNIIINAAKSVSLDSNSYNGNITSILSGVGDINNTRNDVVKGNGGNIQITTGELSVTNDAVLIASTFGEGNAGNIIINATKSVSFDSSKTGAFSSVGEVNSTQNIFAKGKGGNIEITTDKLALTNGAALVASTYAKEGNAGNIILNASSLDFASGGKLLAVTYGAGNAANIQITASKISISGSSSLDGRPSGVFTETRSFGKGGDITINANAFRISGGAVLSARAREDAVGNAGNITVNANLVEATEGGKLVSSTSGKGNAGKITVNSTNQVIVSGSDATLSDRLTKFPNYVVDYGTAASVFIVQSGKLPSERYTNSDSVQASNLGSAGSIFVNSPKVTLDNQGRLIANSTSGNGGDINLQVGDRLLLRHGSLISATAGTDQQGGDGGNININAPFMIAVSNENSDIIANAFNGNGGKIQINSVGVFGFEKRSREDLIRLLKPNNPLDPLDPQQLQTNDITAISQTSPTLSGQVKINTPDIDPSRGLAILPIVTNDTLKLVSSSCTVFNETADSSQFVITGRGGLPPSPEEPLTTDVVWSDTRLPVTTVQQHQGKTYALKLKPIAIMPATGWVLNDHGEVTLVSNATSVSTPTSCPVR